MSKAAGSLRERGGQDFDSDVAPELRVLRAEHLSHPARADGGDDLAGSEPGSGVQGPELEV